MRFVTTRTAAAGFVVGLLAACESPSSGSMTTTAASEPTTTEAAPFHAIPADAVGVTGTALCTFSDTGVTPEGGPGGFRVSCELEMSDPRVSGTEVSDRYRFHNTEQRGGKANVWVAEEVILTNEDGVWRGITQAAETPHRVARRTTSARAPTRISSSTTTSVTSATQLS